MQQRPDEQDLLVDALGRSAFIVMQSLTALAADADLSLTQLRVIAILRDRRVRMSELAEHLGLEKSTVTGLVGRARARGLLERVPDERDRRAAVVVLTERGHELAATLEALIRTALAPSTERLSVGDRHQLRVLLERMLP